MLKKLLKYDLKSMVRLLVPLSLAVIGTTIAGTAALRGIQSVNDVRQGSWILNSTLAILFASTILALIAYVFFSQILIMYRYYTNLFTDEGYLTFTLPAKTSSVLTAKVINAIIWSTYTFVILFLCIFIYAAFGSADTGLINVEFFSGIKRFLNAAAEEYSAGIIVKYVIEGIVFYIVAMLYSTLSIYLALTIGSIIAKKHKILASIGIYYAINTVMSMFMMIVNGILMFTDLYPAYVSAYEANVTGILDTVFIINAGSFLIFAIAAYYLTRHLLKNKLNLS